MKDHSTPTKRDSRTLADLSWGDLGDYCPPEGYLPRPLDGRSDWIVVRSDTEHSVGERIWRDRR